MNVVDTLLDNLDEALIILDNEGKVLFCNEVAAKLSETLFTKPFQQGSPFIDSTNLETGLIIRDIIQEVQVKKLREKHFAEFRNQNGTMVSLEFDFMPGINEEGDETHIHLLIRDITAQKILERKLITQASNFTNLIEKANAIIIGVDTRGYVTDWNEHCMIITGFVKDEVYAQKFVNVLMKDLEPEKFDLILESGLKQESVINHELPIRTQNNNLITLLLSCTPRLSASGEVIGLTLVGQDVTELAEYRRSLEMKVEERTRELKRALQKEKEVVEMKSRFVSIASHEFRSPLSSIKFETNLIKRNKGIDHKKLNQRLEAIEKQTSHMNRLLDDVLTYGKCETGKIQLIDSIIPLKEFLNRIIEEVSHRPEGHLIKTDYRQLPDVIRTDEKLFRSILINLLTNAIKFSPGKEQVYLTVEGSNIQITVKVRDEGIGIPVEELNKIFEPFLRGKGVGKIQGTGLGLSIVKKSVELLNGAIQIESDVNKGTTFIVTIPHRAT